MKSNSKIGFPLPSTINSINSYTDKSKQEKAQVKIEAPNGCLGQNKKTKLRMFYVIFFSCFFIPFHVLTRNYFGFYIFICIPVIFLYNCFVITFRNGRGMPWYVVFYFKIRSRF